MSGSFPALPAGASHPERATVTAGHKRGMAALAQFAELQERRQERGALEERQTASLALLKGVAARVRSRDERLQTALREAERLANGAVAAAAAWETRACKAETDLEAMRARAAKAERDLVLLRIRLEDTENRARIAEDWLKEAHSYLRTVQAEMEQGALR